MINGPISDWIENCSNSSYNNTFYIAVNKLKSKNCIEYSYDITSNITGIFELLTTVRIGGNYSNWVDLTYPKKVEFRPPIFSMDIIKEKSYANVGEPLDVTYALSYRAGWSSEPILRNIRFKTSNENTYSIRINNSIYDGKPIPTWFSPIDETKVNISVYYNQLGNNLLPGIFIENEQISSDTEIYVYYNWIVKFITDLQPVLSNTGLYLAVAFSLVSIYFSRVDIKIMRDSLAAKTKKANKSTRISCKKGKLDCFSVYYCKIRRK